MADVVKALAVARPRPYWLDEAPAFDAAPSLTERTSADLAIVGAGYTGLWTALIAKERDPGRDVVVLESGLAGQAASGRNGGFCSASLTHGLANGASRWPDEIGTLERLGKANLAEIRAAVGRYGIDCDFAPTGELHVATEDWQLPELASEAEACRKLGKDVELLDASGARAQVDSPTYLGALWARDGVAMVQPARLAYGLRQACLDLGVRLYEHTQVCALESFGGKLALTTPYGGVLADQVALGSGAFPSPLRRLRNYVVPVYDYALMTEPLTSEQLKSIGWANRQGVGDSGNQFHYYRLSADNRILWGGYDAVYHFRNGARAELEQRPQTFSTLARHFFETFPQLSDIRFSHSWGGVIDTCSRFCAFFGTAYHGRLAYALGYTGLGVGATRFGAEVMLDLLSGEPTERTELEMVRSKPVPFPPEPLRYGVIQLTRWSIAQADRNRGRRNLWLRALDRMGAGFDS